MQTTHQSDYAVVTETKRTKTERERPTQLRKRFYKWIPFCHPLQKT